MSDATTGNRTDSGTSSFVIRSMTDPGAPASFQEAFNSTGTACEDGNNGNGNGHGHPKPKNDNDDDEVCP